MKRLSFRTWRQWIAVGSALLSTVILVLWFSEELGTWWATQNLVLRQSIVTGLLMGGVYGLAALGLTLIFGVLGIINFAHGTIISMGMYLTFVLFSTYDIDPYLSLAIVAPTLFFVGILMYRLLLRQTMTGPAHNQLLVTLGLALIIENILLLVFRADPRTVRPSYSSSGFFLGDTYISLPRLLAFLFALLLGVMLYTFLRTTQTGRAIRAAAQDRIGAQLVGIPVSRIEALTLGIGTAAGGAAGTLIMPFFTVTPTTGATFNITAFVIVVLGGMGNVAGAVLGGLIVGLVEALGAVFLPGSTKQIGVFLLFILLLLFRPSGLFGRGHYA